MNIFVIGSYVQGYCWQVPTVPQAGETLIANGLNIESGGKGLNVAVCSKRLGAHADVLFGIGEDLAGEQLKRLLQTEQIATTHTHPLAELSGSAVGMIGSNGQNAIAVLLGPNLLLNESHVNLASDAIENADIVYAQFEGAMAAIEASFTIAKSPKKKKSTKTVLNPSPWQDISTALLNNTDIILVNEIEVLNLLKIYITQVDKNNVSFNTLDNWQAFLSPIVKSFFATWLGEMLIVTLGELGCIAFDKHQKVTAVPAFKVKAIDTICCGDAFASGFCVLYLNKSLAETLTFANACGAIVATKSGMLGTLPNLNQVNDFLKTHTLQ